MDEIFQTIFNAVMDAIGDGLKALWNKIKHRIQTFRKCNEKEDPNGKVQGL